MSQSEHLNPEHLSEEDLVLIYYGEPEVAGERRLHLGGCAECRAAAARLAETLDACDAWTTPEPGPRFEQRVWTRLLPALAPRPARDFRWLAAAAAVVLAVGAFMAGRMSRVSPRSSSAAPILSAGLSGVGLSAQARQKILEITIADHLDRAERLLTEVSNSRVTEADRERARDLVSEGRLLRASLEPVEELRGEPAGDASLSAVLDEVERFMLEAANGTGASGAPDSGVLLFKVRIVESNIRTRGEQL